MIKLTSMRPSVSVIIPTHNRQWALRKAIDSVLNQSFQDFELLVVDDGSTDQTQERVIEPLLDGRLRAFQTENKGVSAARNFAIQQARGEWIAFLDSDDEWLPDKLTWQMQALQTHPEWRWLHGEEIWIRNGKRVNAMKKHGKKGGDIFADALKLCCVSPSTVMIHRNLFQEVGLFREDFPVCEDYDLWLKLSARYEVGFIPTPIVVKNGGHADQLSRRYVAMDYWRILALGDLLRKDLSEDKIVLACHELISKAQILLKGYRKHANLESYDVIFAKMKKAEQMLRLYPL